MHARIISLSLILFVGFACPGSFVYGRDVPSFQLDDRRGGKGRRRLPPAWDKGGGGIYEDAARVRANARRKPRPWYKPRFAVGMGFGFPDIIPLEAYAIFGKYFALRAFYTPPLPFNIRVEMPADIIQVKNDVAIANPDFTVRFDALYGPLYGWDAMVFPFGGSFFLSAGASFRRLELEGEAQSPVRACSLAEAAKEPPCGRKDASIRTRTQLRIEADAVTTSLLGRARLGGLWHVGDSGYFAMAAGLAVPTRTHRDVEVRTGLKLPGDESPEIRGALLKLKKDREKELEKKAKKEMRPADERSVPMLSVGAGIRF